MAIQIIKRRNFSAPLPVDFYALKSLTRLDDDERLALTQFPCPNTPYQQVFMIGRDKLFFPGDYSRWRVIKWFQEIKESWFPVKYRLEYFSINETKTGY